MASDGLSVNSVVISIIAVSIGVVLIGSLLAPIAADVMADLTSQITVNNQLVDKYENGGTWSSLIGVVVIMAILGLVIVAVNNYTKKN